MSREVTVRESRINFPQLLVVSIVEETRGPLARFMFANVEVDLWIVWIILLRIVDLVASVYPYFERHG